MIVWEQEEGGSKHTHSPDTVIRGQPGSNVSRAQPRRGVKSPTGVVAGGSGDTQCASKEECGEAQNGLCPQGGGALGLVVTSSGTHLSSSGDHGLSHRPALARALSQHWKWRLKWKAGVWIHHSHSHPKIQCLFSEMIQLCYILEAATHSPKPGGAWPGLPLEFSHETPTSQGLGLKSGETCIQSRILSHLMETSPCSKTVLDTHNSLCPC